MRLADDLPATRPRRLALAPDRGAISREDLDRRRPSGLLTVDPDRLSHEPLERVAVTPEPGRPDLEIVAIRAHREGVGGAAISVRARADRPGERHGGRCDLLLVWLRDLAGLLARGRRWVDLWANPCAPPQHRDRDRSD